MRTDIDLRREDEPIPVLTPLGGSTPGEMLQQGAILMRIENDSMLAAAKLKPRDPQGCLRRALGELELDPEEAHDARYSLPFADRSEGEGDATTRVEGLSINAAMALARCWGNCSTSARIISEDPAGFNVSGVFIDLETNFRVERPMRVSKYLKLSRARGGRVIVMDPRRQLMALQAGASKALRNAILAGLPSGMKNPYERRAIAIAAGGDPDARADEAIMEKVVDAFRRRWDVGLSDLEAYLGRIHHWNDTDAPMPAAEWRGRHVADLRALFTSLRDGQISRDAAFAKPETAEAEAPVRGPHLVRPEGLGAEQIAAGAVRSQDNAPPGSNAPTRPEAEAKASTAAPDLPAPAGATPGPAPAQRSLADF